MPDIENGNVDRGDDFKSPLDDAGLPDGTKPDADPKPDGTKPDADPKPDPAGDKLEGDETPEEKAERERQEAEEAKKRNIRIPKARFDEAQAKAREREQRLLDEIERLKGGQQTSQAQKAVADMQAQIDALQDKYEDLILDGKKEEARAARKKADALREELIEYKTTVKSDAARLAAIEDLKYDAQLASMESKYTALNPEHADFDEDKTNEVAALLNAFVKSGTKRAEALTKAVRYVMGSPDEQKTTDAARVLAEERARKAREKAADANNKQPPSTAKVGLDTDKAGKPGTSGVDVMRMSQEKFAKLDDETKAKLRGDEL